MRESAQMQTRWTQIFAFAVAGGLSTAVHWSTMAALVLLAVQPLVATAIGSIAGAVANYVLQRRLAFREAGAHRTVIARYLLACLFAWLANLLVFALLHDVLIVPVAIAQVLTTLAIALLNFIVYQRLVFL